MSCWTVEEVEGFGDRQSEDQVINEQGRVLLDFTRLLCVANGRAGSGDRVDMIVGNFFCSGILYIVSPCLLYNDYVLMC